MRRLLLIAIMVVCCHSIVNADDKTEATAKDFLRKIFAGDIQGAKELSAVPFSFDRKDLIKDEKDIEGFFNQITTQNGKLDIAITSIKEIEDRKGVHKELKDEIIVYEIEFKIKDSTEKLQVFIRKKDGKVVGLFG